jgi:hypothetical protein
MATPENLPGLPSVFVATLQTARRPLPGRVFAAPEANSSPRKSGSLLKIFG